MQVFQRFCYQLALIGCLSCSLPVLADNPQANYPPPPAGVNWGWQGEVLFKVNSAQLRAEEKPILNRLANQLLNYPALSILITGHADNTGNLALNQRLSVQRVNAIVQYFTSKGVDRSRITTQGTGEQRPVASNACPEDRVRNRRADLAFYPTGTTPPYSTLVEGDSRPEPGECEEEKADQRDMMRGR